MGVGSNLELCVIACDQKGCDPEGPLSLFLEETLKPVSVLQIRLYKIKNLCKIFISKSYWFPSF